MSASERSDACRSCDAPLGDETRFCGRCGTARSADRLVVEREHHATVVVSDLQGSTALAERLDPESLRLVLDQYFDEMGRVLGSHGGRIEKRIGDAMVTVFGAPVAKPDDAARAVRAVAECQATLANLNQRLERVWNVRLTNRTGVATGRVIITDAGGGHRVLAGPALDHAMALEPAAPANEALLAAETVVELYTEATFDPPSSYRTKNGAELVAHRLIAVGGDALAAAAEAAEAPEAADDSSSGLELDHATLPSCPACGTPLISDPAPDWCTECGLRLGHGHHVQSRRTLTILFADVRAAKVDSTGPIASTPVDQTTIRQGLVLCFDAVRAALERHGGIVEKYIGDAIMAVFGLDQRREDDALRAIRAGLEMQTTVSRLNRGGVLGPGYHLEARIGINTGPVIAGDSSLGQRLVTGDAVNVAARLEQAAGPGHVVIGALTRRLCDDALRVEELDPLSLKGKTDPVPAARVLSAGPARGTGVRPAVPMIGRQAELARLLEMLGHVEDPNGRPGLHRVNVRGEAGSGKSRLVNEFLYETGRRGVVVRTMCLPYGDGITFWPILELIGELSGVDTDDEPSEALAKINAVTDDPAVTARLASLMGLVDEPFPLSEIFWAVRRLIEHVSRTRPFVLTIDGLHWAEPTFLELLDSLQTSVAVGRSLLVTMARPDTLADESGQPLDEQDPDRVDTIELGPLTDDEVGELLHLSLSGTPPDAVRSQVVRVAGGNPLFVEQIAIMLVEGAQIVRRNEAWVVTRATGQLDVPPTVEALLAARIDALNSAERETLAPASIIGREFPQAAVLALAQNMAREEVVSALIDLGRRRLVMPASNPDALVDHRFTSLLVRDVVYAGLLKRTRADWHQAFASWLEDAVGTRVGEYTEVIGYHLEQGYHYLRQLGTEDVHVADIGERAFRHLAPAGERAFVRGDMRAASGLLTRAAKLLPTTKRDRNRTLIRAGEALMQTGAFSDAIALFDEAQAGAESAADGDTAAAAELARGTVRYQTGDNFDDAAAGELVGRLQPVFEAAQDHASAARCWKLVAYTRLTNSRWGAAEGALTEVLEHARLADDSVLALRVMPGLVGFALHGPTSVPVAIAKALELRHATSADRRARALTERYLGHLLALDDRGEEGRSLCSEARVTLLELGWNFEAALVSIDLGPIELSLERPDEAERVLRSDFETLRDMGEHNYLSTTAGFLAESVRRQGRLDEALELAEFSAGLVAPGDTLTQALWREVSALSLAEKGQIDRAESLAREALMMVLETDGLTTHAEAHVTLAEVLRAGGRIDESSAAAADALTCFAQKGHRPGIRRVRTLIRSLSDPTS